LGNPGVGAARKSDFFADLVGGAVIELGELPVMEDAKIVELLLDRAGNAWQFLEVVGGAPRTRKALEAARLRRGRNFLGDGLGGRTDVDARIALAARDAI